MDRPQLLWVFESRSGEKFGQSVQGGVMVAVDPLGLQRHHQRTGAKRTRTGQQLNQGGIIDIETFVDISNIQLVCGNCHKLTRPGHRVNDEGAKERFCRKCEAVL